MKKYIGFALVFIVAGLVSCADSGRFGPQGSSGWMPMMNYGYGYGVTFMWIALLIVIGLLVYFSVRSRKTTGPTCHESPLDILQRRYAKGEIDKEAYESMKKDIEGGNDP